MAEEDDSGDKTEEPSQYRLEEFRKKGDVASSKELASVLILLGTILTLILSIVFIVETLTEFINWIYSLNHETAYSDKILKQILSRTIICTIKCTAPVFFVSFTIGILTQLLQVGLIYAPDMLSMKLERINPQNGLKRLFSLKPLFETFKGIFKFTIIISISYNLLKKALPTMQGFLQVDATALLMMGRSILAKLGFSILLGLGVVAILDYAWEKYQYIQKLKTSKQQVKEEMRNKEGNPEIKQRIKTLQKEIAQKRMMNSVPNADLIVTNPTHYSVAIKYDCLHMISPTVLAKGVDQSAMMIRKIAKKHNIPIVENIPLARALYNTVKVGNAVPRNLYKAVAEVLAFVYRLQKKQTAIATGTTSDKATTLGTET